MRSSEVARLAGVTVRALRHYHAIGLLPEPARSDNGYRDYDIDDLVRVLRVKRLASLGFPLERIGGMLEELDADAVADGGLSAAERQLDELDAELARQIERLERQRHTIAEIKRERSLPDMPKRGARLMEVVRDIERMPARRERRYHRPRRHALGRASLRQRRVRRSHAHLHSRARSRLVGSAVHHRRALRRACRRCPRNRSATNWWTKRSRCSRR